MDKEHADFERVFTDIKAHLTPKVVPVEVPVGDGPDFHGIINLFSGHCHFYKKGATKGENEVVPIPDEYQARYQEYNEHLTEAVASTDDELIERYLAGEEIPREQFIGAVKKAMLAGQIVPLFCGSATQTYGLRTLLRKMVELFPAPSELPAAGGGAARGPRVQDHVRAPRGRRHPVPPLRRRAPERRRGMERGARDRREAQPPVNPAGQGAHRGRAAERGRHRLGGQAQGHAHRRHLLPARRPVRLPPIPLPESEATSAVVVKQRGEEDKLAAGLHKLHEEDPTFHFEYSSELGQTLIHGMGERHFETILQRLERKFGVHAELARPRVAYRETIKGKAEGQGKHKKQSGGRGQYGDCWIRMSPRPRGAGYEFVDDIVGGVIPNKYIPAVDRGVQESAERGVVAGYPMVDFQVECFDGSYHDVDSNEMSFKMAGILAFRNVAPKARPVLLEPLVEVTTWAPDDLLGEVMGDLSARRGQILGTEQDGRLTKVRAIVPEAELYKYSTTLHSITHGRGAHREKFHGYAEAPPEVAAKVAAENQKEHAVAS